MTETALLIPPKFYQVNANITINTTVDGALVSFPLTRDIFLKVKSVQSGQNTKYPLICDNYRINFAKLVAEPYDKMVSRFFNISHLNSYLDVTNYNPPVEGADSSKSTLVYNFTNMLVLLFPTNMPFMNNVAFSSDIDMPNVISWMYTYHNSYSHLVNKGKTYTVFKTTWLNDVRNNPRYAGLIDECLRFSEWRTKWMSDKSKKTELLKLDSKFNEAFNALTYRGNSNFFNYIIDKVSRTVSRNIGDNMITDFKSAFTQIHDAYFPVKKEDSERLAIVLENMRSINNISDILRSQTTSTSQVLNLVIRELGPYFTIYKLAEQQNLVFEIIEKINIQYKNVDNVSTDYVDKNYPEFVQFTNAITTFVKTYDIDNVIWKKMLFDIVNSVDQLGAATLDKILRISLSEGTDEEQWVGLDRLKIPNKLQTGGLPRSSQRFLSAKDTQVVVADLHIDVIGGHVTSENVQNIQCAFKDYYIGVYYQRLTSTTKHDDWRVYPLQFFPAEQLLLKSVATAPANRPPAPNIEPPTRKPQLPIKGGNQNTLRVQHRHIPNKTQRYYHAD